MGKKQKQQQTDEYLVKEIIDKKQQKVKGTTVIYYKVLWDGYPEQQATWEKATKLIKCPAIKKQIQNFNNKHKTINKNKPNFPHIKKTHKKDTIELKSPSSNSPYESTIQAKIKKDTIELEKNSSPKINKTTKNISDLGGSKDKTKQSLKETDSKSDIVVEKILEKMRENVTKKKKQNHIPIEQKISELNDKIKDKTKLIPKGKQALKSSTKNTTESNTQSKLKKVSTLKPILEQSETQEPISLEVGPQNMTGVSTISPIEEKQVPLLSVSCVNRIIDQIIEEKSSISKAIEKSTDENKSLLNENIKLQITDELQDHLSSKGKESLAEGIEYYQNSCLQKDEFIIKGMMVSKGEYFYLVEENGKSNILSRAVMLDKYPYELIVFYEKRINIKPAEISMMVL